MLIKPRKNLPPIYIINISLPVQVTASTLLHWHISFSFPHWSYSLLNSQAYLHATEHRDLPWAISNPGHYVNKRTHQPTSVAALCTCQVSTGDLCVSWIFNKRQRCAANLSCVGWALLALSGRWRCKRPAVHGPIFLCPARPGPARPDEFFFVGPARYGPLGRHGVAKEQLYYYISRES